MIMIKDSTKLLRVLAAAAGLLLAAGCAEESLVMQPAPAAQTAKSDAGWWHCWGADAAACGVGQAPEKAAKQ